MFIQSLIYQFQYVLLILVPITFIHINAQNPCDDPYGQYCPESSGWDVGQCLQDLDSNVKEDFSKECKVFIDLHKYCIEDINKYCLGKEYTGDLLPCLIEWTPIESISKSCVDSFPKKEETNSDSNSGKDSKKAKKNAEKRRR